MDEKRKLKWEDRTISKLRRPGKCTHLVLVEQRTAAKIIDLSSEFGLQACDVARYCVDAVHAALRAEAGIVPPRAELSSHPANNLDVAKMMHGYTEKMRRHGRAMRSKRRGVDYE